MTARQYAAAILAGLAIVLMLAACGGHTSTVVPTSPPQSPTSSQNSSSAYALGKQDALSDIRNGVGPGTGQTAYNWCDLQLYGGAGTLNDGGDSAAWFAGCQAGVAQAS